MIERKSNSCFILKDESNGKYSTVEEARAVIRRRIESYRREEVRLMVEAQGKSYSGVLPKEFKESTFNLYKICHYLYNKGDEYRLPVKRAFADIQALIYDPILIN